MQCLRSGKTQGGSKVNRVVGELDVPRIPETPRVEGHPQGGETCGVTPGRNEMLGGYGLGQGGD